MLARKYLLTLVVALAACRDVSAGDALDAGSGADGASADATPAAHPGEVWVMAWNLQTFPKAVSTVARVGQVLASMPVDVVGVEEIQDLDAFAQLDTRLADFQGVLASNGDGYSRVGLLYRSSTVSVDGVETLFLGDGQAFPRPPLAAHVHGQGVDLTLVVVHLKAQSDAASQARRKAAVGKLDTWMKARAGERILVVGDWNDEVTDPAADNVFQALLDQPDTYTVLTLPLAQMPGESTYIPIPGFIDHMVLTHNALGEWGAGSTEVLHLDASDPQYESILSDHRPVLTRFHPPPAP